jgi:methylase of polypeptide subunit release factors
MPLAGVGNATRGEPFCALHRRSGLTDQDQALLELLGVLRARGYSFVTPTPETHRRVIRRLRQPGPASLRDVFGWSLAFGPEDLDDELMTLMADAGVLRTRGRRLISRIRVSSRGEMLFVHSAYPTKDKDAVFFGPDSYRFADFIERELGADSAFDSLVDVGAGAGVGALTAARGRSGARVVMTDVNDTALRYARVNAAFAGVQAEFELDDGLNRAESRFDLVLANPPYIAGRTGSDGRTYRDGGDMLGAALSLDWAESAMKRLTPGGRLLLYTGSAIVNGEDRLRAELEKAAPAHGCDLRYREIDPDVFGEELSRPVYREAERIAVIGAVVSRRT